MARRYYKAKVVNYIEFFADDALTEPRREVLEVMASNIAYAHHTSYGHSLKQQIEIEEEERMS